MHVVRDLVVSCALVTCQCELLSGGCMVVSGVFVAPERGAKYSACQGF